mmetsp:Transcript_36504/g.64306  ORF Transcript_36504/g.64306 Transcript_36504/m.64306 type:complete len:557 (+) Transcript_36504:174-1844(+)
MVESCLQSLPQEFGIGTDLSSDSDEAQFTVRSTEWAAETVLDLRDAPPPSLATPLPELGSGCPGERTPGTAFSAGPCSSRSSSSGSSGLRAAMGAVGQNLGAQPNGELVDLEQLLQALLVEEGLVEDEGRANGDAGVTPSTLREMRRTGALGALHQEAQSALLAGPLFEYGDVQASSRAPEMDTETEMEVQREPTVAHLPVPNERPSAPRLTLDWLLELGQGDEEAVDADGDAWEQLLNTSRSQQAADGSAWERLLNSARSQQAHSARLGSAQAGSARTGSARTSSARTGSARTASARTSSVQTPVTQQAVDRGLGQVLAASPGSPHSALSDSDSSQSHATVMQHISMMEPAEEDESISNMEQSLDEAEEEVVSVFDVSDEPPSARIAAHARALLGDLARSPGTASPPSVDGAGNGFWSSMSSTRTNPGNDRPPTHREAAETALLDGSLNSMLRRLTVESQLLDESLTRSVRRVLQLGTVLAGQRLSDEEIRALPKVRFESAEQQHCAICLEAYQEGELLTALRCSHFFHIGCLARWMQRATVCPLCRTHCGSDPD